MNWINKRSQGSQHYSSARSRSNHIPQCMKASDSQIQADKRFLAGTSSERLRAIHKEEKDPKAADRLLAYAMRKEGMSIRQICGALNRPRAGAHWRFRLGTFCLPVFGNRLLSCTVWDLSLIHISEPTRPY